MTGVLHTARINTIEVIMSSDKLIKMVNFKLGNEMWRWINQDDKSVVQRKILSPRQELNPGPPEPRAGALSTELQELMETWKARSFNRVHMWQASCILLRSALSKSPWVVISELRRWILSSVTKCERWIDQHDTNVGQRKNLSPRQESNSRPPEHRAGALSTELRELKESKVI